MTARAEEDAGIRENRTLETDPSLAQCKRVRHPAALSCPDRRDQSLQNQRKAHSLSRALHLFYRDGQTYWYEVPTGLEVGISECGTKTESHIPRMPFLGTWRLYPRILMSRILSHFRLME
jgi:hypothetical protein